MPRIRRMEENTETGGAGAESRIQRLDLRRSARDESFYAVGGPVQPDRDCYIERPADRELYERLSAGEFCHVLSPRQSGKSSLVARCAKRLRSAGFATAVVDLARVPRKPPPAHALDPSLAGSYGRRAAGSAQTVPDRARTLRT